MLRNSDLTESDFQGIVHKTGVRQVSHAETEHPRHEKTKKHSLENNGSHNFNMYENRQILVFKILKHKKSYQNWIIITFALTKNDKILQKYLTKPKFIENLYYNDHDSCHI